MTSYRAPRLGPRLGIPLVLLLSAGFAAHQLQLSPANLTPNQGGLELLGQFLGAALEPALTYESGYVPDGSPGFLTKLASASLRTFLFALAAMSLAMLVGLPLGILASASWWNPDENFSRAGLHPLHLALRGVIAGMRSVHEILWAILFLAAFGMNSFSAVVALAIPYGGTLAKVYSEMLDEAPKATLNSLQGAGVAASRAYAFGLIPQAVPDLVAYSFYRLECCIRSTAVLGFFGYETLGYHIALSFGDTHYGEVWTYVYALLLMVLVIEFWSSMVRRRLTV